MTGEDIFPLGTFGNPQLGLQSVGIIPQWLGNV